MKKYIIGSISFIVLICLCVVGYQYFSNKHLVNSYVKPEPPKELAEHYDVIVVGGEPEGVAAAVSAARNGAKTLLIEKRPELGGLFTFGMLNFIDVPKDLSGNTLSKGIYKEWYKLIGRDLGFGIEEAKAAFTKLVKSEKNLTLATKTEVTQAIVENQKLSEVTVKSKYGTTTISADSFIDATQDADLAVMAGAPYFIGAEDLGDKDRRMAVTLMIHLNNVDWSGVRKVVKSNEFGEAKMTWTVAWGFEQLINAYTPVNENTRLRGLNLVKEGNDYYINALQIFNIDGLNEQAKAQAIETGKAETEHILSFLQKEFKGFENATIASYPTELYVRETRHIYAEYQLPMSDIWTNRTHYDDIGYGAYPVDVQAQTPHDYGYVISSPDHYGIPFRSLVPQEIDSLLVVGRSAGYSSIAAGSARIVPTGMVAGEAAGVTAAFIKDKKITFRELSKKQSYMDEIRDILDDQGALVAYRESSYPYQDEWYDTSIQTLMNKGLLVAGYTNELPVDQKTTYLNFMGMMRTGIARTIFDSDLVNQESVDAIYSGFYSDKTKQISSNDIIKLFGTIFKTEQNADVLLEKGILTEQTLKHVKLSDEPLLYKEVYAFTADALQYLENSK